MYDTILIPTDGSEAATAAADHGLALAARFDAEAHVLSVVDPDRYATDVVGDVEDLVTRQRAALERRAREAIDRATADASLPVETHVVEGRPATVLRDTIDAREVDFVAMGVHGRSGLDRYLLGSLTERTVRTAPVPVLAVRAGGSPAGAVDDVLLATDGSEGADRAATHAAAVARATDATLHALTVGDDGTPARRAAAEARASGLAATPLVHEGTRHEAFVAAADERGADLVVVGTHGRTGVERVLLGSVAERVLRTSPVPVLVVGP